MPRRKQKKPKSSQEEIVQQTFDFLDTLEGVISMASEALAAIRDEEPTYNVTDPRHIAENALNSMLFFLESRGLTAPEGGEQ